MRRVARQEDWSLCAPGAYGGDRKSLDVHMHLMEAFTNLYEVRNTVTAHRSRAVALCRVVRAGRC